MILLSHNLILGNLTLNIIFCEIRVMLAPHNHTEFDPEIKLMTSATLKFHGCPTPYQALEIL